MPVITVTEDHLPRPALLRRALCPCPPERPVVILVHGFRYDPRSLLHDPRVSVFARQPEGDVSWSAHLRLWGEGAAGVGFAWRARGTIWHAQAGARRASRRLARLLDRLEAAEPGRPVHVFAHSMGARVALLAMAARPGRVARAVLVAPAMGRAEARAAFAGAGGAQVWSVTARANLLFDVLLRVALPHRGPTLAGGIGAPLPGWTDLSLDDAGALARLGARVRPGRRVCHWGGYSRPGVWPIYRRLLLGPGRRAANRAGPPLAPAAPRATLEAA